MMSYARPSKLFSANVDLIERAVGTLTDEAFQRIIGAVVALLKGNSLP